MSNLHKGSCLLYVDKGFVVALGERWTALNPSVEPARDR